MALRGTDPESYITDFTLVCEDKARHHSRRARNTVLTTLHHLRILIYWVIHDSGQVSLEHLLLS